MRGMINCRFHYVYFLDCDSNYTFQTLEMQCLKDAAKIPFLQKHSWFKGIPPAGEHLLLSHTPLLSLWHSCFFDLAAK